MARIGVIHPGEMGAGIAGALVRAGQEVFWVGAGRSASTRARATAAGLRECATLEELCATVELVCSICPPHAALDVATEVARCGFDGWYLDANAVSPRRAEEIAAVVAAGGARAVDGGLVGGPPPADRTRLYLSGPEAPAVAALVRSDEVAVHVLDAGAFAASALKMTYAAWTKGSAALVLAIRASARRLGVDGDLLAEWADSVPGLLEQSRRAARQAEDRGWRWVGEMEEIAETFADAGLPDGFHAAAAEVYRRVPRRQGAAADDATLEEVLAALLATR